MPVTTTKPTSAMHAAIATVSPVENLLVTVAPYADGTVAHRVRRSAHWLAAMNRRFLLVF
jgi:hypothetical protein